MLTCPTGQHNHQHGRSLVSAGLSIPVSWGRSPATKYCNLCGGPDTLGPEGRPLFIQWQPHFCAAHILPLGRTIYGAGQFQSSYSVCLKVTGPLLETSRTQRGHNALPPEEEVEEGLSPSPTPKLIELPRGEGHLKQTTSFFL